ncbi:MAG TPA: enoyl-CoA hydratase/isomerase family protein [Acidimicrobiales bacterium]|nr:enoyl-CoA hydratase/isomerase family protein [Acidimicrobiales bacterium]
MGDEGILGVASDGPVAVLTFRRPEVLNALDRDLLACLIEALGRVGSEPRVRAIVLTGAGRAFMAGADVRLMARASLPEFRRFVEDIQELTRVIRACPVPVIAAVNGIAVGAGCEIACACDIRLASRTAVLGFPEARLGLVVTSGASWLLPGLVGRGWARRMLFTGETLEADEAHRIGLVDGICEPDEILGAAVALGARLAGSEPLAVRLSRSLLDAGEASSLETALRHEVEAILSCFCEGQAREGLEAFLEKREPHYRAVADEEARR